MDLIEKHGQVRTVPMPTWVEVAIDAWATAAGICVPVPESRPRTPANTGPFCQNISGAALLSRVTAGGERLSLLKT